MHGPFAGIDDLAAAPIAHTEVQVELRAAPASQMRQKGERSGHNRLSSPGKR